MSPLTLCELYSRCDVGSVRVTVFVSPFFLFLYLLSMFFFAVMLCWGSSRLATKNLHIVSYHII